MIRYPVTWNRQTQRLEFTDESGARINIPRSGGGGGGVTSHPALSNLGIAASGHTFLATQRVMGRNTAGAGAAEEVTASQVLDWIGSTRGSLLYRGVAAWAALTPGTATHVLTSNGAGADPSWQAGGGGGGGGTTGTAEVNFGASGSIDTSVAVTGQAAIVSGSIVQAWLRCVDTADHLADEHWVESRSLRIEVVDIVAATGFTIRATYDSGVEASYAPHDGYTRFQASATTVGLRQVQPARIDDPGGKAHKAYGRYAVQWRWS